MQDVGEKGGWMDERDRVQEQGNERRWGLRTNEGDGGKDAQRDLRRRGADR